MAELTGPPPPDAAVGFPLAVISLSSNSGCRSWRQRRSSRPSAAAARWIDGSSPAWRRCRRRVRVSAEPSSWAIGRSATSLHGNDDVLAMMLPPGVSVALVPRGLPARAYAGTDGPDGVYCMWVHLNGDDPSSAGPTPAGGAPGPPRRRRPRAARPGIAPAAPARCAAACSRVYVCRHRAMAVVLYAALAIVLAILVLLAAIICTAGSAPTKPKDKLDPPAADLPDIVAPRRRHVPERGVGAAL
eukprot:COSAG03_NODE_2252_length_2957_cov_3.832750_2_plen_244_part_00